MGKAYANKKPELDRPKGDFYSTPKSLIWVAKDIILSEFITTKTILEPCCGQGAISTELKSLGYNVVENDLYFNNGVDYLENNFTIPYMITNPPFSLWDEFVHKAKKECEKIMIIGRLNYLCTHSRLVNKTWENLKTIYCFDRYVDYRTPFRDDGYFNVGAMATGWFIWEKGFIASPTISILEVQNYAKLGNYKE